MLSQLKIHHILISVILFIWMFMLQSIAHGFSCVKLFPKYHLEKCVIHRVICFFLFDILWTRWCSFNRELPLFSLWPMTYITSCRSLFCIGVCCRKSYEGLWANSIFFFHFLVSIKFLSCCELNVFDGVSPY